MVPLEKFRGNAWLDVAYSVAGGSLCGGWTFDVNTCMHTGGLIAFSAGLVIIYIIITILNDVLYISDARYVYFLQL